MENVNLNTEIHCHFEYCISILHITLQIEICYTYASIVVVSQAPRKIVLGLQLIQSFEKLRFSYHCRQTPCIQKVRDWCISD